MPLIRAAQPDNSAQPDASAQPASASDASTPSSTQSTPSSTQSETTLTALDVQFEGRDCDTLDLVIARPNPDHASPDEGGRASVGYSINNDPANGPVGLLRREDRSPSDNVLSGGRAALIAPCVSELNLQFYDGTDWVDGWSGDNGWPKAVRIKIVVLDEAGLENPLSLTTTVSVMAR